MARGPMQLHRLKAGPGTNTRKQSAIDPVAPNEVCSRNGKCLVRSILRRKSADFRGFKMKFVFGCSAFAWTGNFLGDTLESVRAACLEKIGS